MYYLRLKQSAALVIVLTVILACITSLTGCSLQEDDQKLPVQVLILPKFEKGEMEGDFPGEAQYFYEEYLAGGDAYDIEGCPEANKLYYKDGIALCLTGEGKVAAALTTSSVLSDKRFDFSDAYILSVGCGGAAEGYGILGDVFVITAAVDYDLGHHADPREASGGSETTWYHEEVYDDSAVIRLDQSLTDRVFEKVKNVPLKTTEQSLKFLRKEYPGEEMDSLQPQVMRGTSVTGDNYWKGRYGHQNALLMAETYDCRDPFAISEMEDVAVGQAVKRCGLLQRLIVLRVGVNMDVFPAGVTPEMLWGKKSDDELASDESMESIDIFETAMENCFNTSKVLIDAIRNGEL